MPSSPTAAAAINQAVGTYISEHPVGTVPLIVETNGDPAAVEEMVRQGGGHVDSQFSVLSGFSASVSPTLAWQLNHDPRVKRLNLNFPIQWMGSVNTTNLANRYERLGGIPTAWSGGLDGSEVQVAVIDSGVWPHNDLTQRSPYVPSGGGNRLLDANTNPRSTDALDHVGHGTHVAGVVGGNGRDSGGQYIGVAPNSLLIGVKIADDLGNANEGDVITGLEWVYQANKHGMHIKLINLSLMSTVAQSYHQSALDAMVEKLWKSGVTVVAAAGNGSGPVNYAPGNDPMVITVGSIDDNYQTSLPGSNMASWALFGRTQDGFNKPDVVADGAHVVSLLAPGSTLSVQHLGNVVGTSYFKMGGTSMAAPQVVGLAALMLQNNPNLTPNKIKRLLKNHTSPFSATAYTSWLGTSGGYADESAVGTINPGYATTDEGDDNGSVAFSQSFDPVLNNVLAGGAWWGGAAFTNVSWNNVSWNNVSWNSTQWSAASWTQSCGLSGCSLPVLNSTVWTNVSWNNVSWNNVSWNNVSWNNVSWNNVSWNNVSWNNVSWNNVSWNNVSWNDGTFQ
jgi:serine protease AprX